MRTRRALQILGAVLATAAVALTGCSAAGESTSAAPGEFDAASYFKGRNIRVIVSHSAGGGTDLAARDFAASLGSLLPGNPRVSVTNDSGMGGINNAYSAPEKDLVIGVTSLGANLFQPLLDPANTYDPKGVKVIAAVTPEPRGALVAGEFAKTYPKLTDATGKTGAPVRFAAVVGGPADVISEAFIAPWVCEQLSLPCTMVAVAGDSSSDTELMLQRGEINSNFTAIGAISRSHNQILTDHSGYVAFSYEDQDTKISYPDGVTPAPKLVDILPQSSLDQWKLIQPLVTGGGLGKTFWMGPSARPEVVDAMRKAWTDFTADKDLYEKFDKIQTGAVAPGAITFTSAPIQGADAQKLYDASTDTFMSNKDTYATLQSQLYDKYWKS